MTGTEEVLFLALESSTAVGSVAVGSGSGLLAEVSFRSRAGHSSALLPAADFALREAGVSTRDLAGIVVGAGPGSFTGVRIAGATAKGIVHARGIPLLAYSSLLAAAASAMPREGVVGAIFDARGRDVYAACYAFGSTLETPVAPAAMTLEEAITHCREFGASLMVGDGASKHADELGREMEAEIAPPHLAFPRAGVLIWLAAAFPAAGLVVDPAAWEPDYLRPSGAERIAAARAAGGSGEGSR